jgi:peptide/nickel transport system substrate-binding protein
MHPTTFDTDGLSRRTLLQAAASVLTLPMLAHAQPAGGTLRIALSSLRGEVLDPVQGHPDKSLKLPLYDWLVGVNAEGTEVSAATGLATGWETSSDGLSWTFRIREGVPFHKGNGTVTAEDVAFSLQRILSPEANTGAVPYFKGVIAAIEAPNKTTVVVRLKRKAVDLHIMLSPLRQTEGMVVPKAYFEKVGRDEFLRNPVGTGPFEFVSRAPGALELRQATRAATRIPAGAGRLHPRHDAAQGRGAIDRPAAPAVRADEKGRQIQRCRPGG